MKFKCISYTILFVVYVFVTIPLFAQDKRNDSFSENEMATIKKLALEALLENPEIREGIKIFSDWPTIPQLYIKGEFVGGCDIVKEMFEKGELKKMFEEKKLI